MTTKKSEEVEEVIETNKMGIAEKLQNCRVELQKMNLKKTGENEKFKAAQRANSPLKLKVLELYEVIGKR